MLRHMHRDSFLYFIACVNFLFYFLREVITCQGCKIFECKYIYILVIMIFGNNYYVVIIQSTMRILLIICLYKFSEED